MASARIGSGSTRPSVCTFSAVSALVRTASFQIGNADSRKRDEGPAKRPFVLFRADPSAARSPGDGWCPIVVHEWSLRLENELSKHRLREWRGL